MIMIYGKVITKSTIYEICCVFIAISIGVISYIYAFKTNEPLWFARSGSMMVLFSIMAEYSNYNVQLFINSAATKGAGSVGGGVGLLSQPKFRIYLSRVTHITAAVGTFIWGYGDIFIKQT